VELQEDYYVVGNVQHIIQFFDKNWQDRPYVLYALYCDDNAASVFSTSIASNNTTFAINAVLKSFSFSRPPFLTYLTKVTLNYWSEKPTHYIW